MEQLQFSGVSQCDEFQLNKMRLNATHAKVVCIDCSYAIGDHKASAVKEADVDAYLAHLEGSDGGNLCIAATETLGAVYIGARGVSLAPYVNSNNIKAVVNASNLHLINRRDFKEWSSKVEKLEKDGVIVVLRLGWGDVLDQELTRLDEALEFIHTQRLSGNVAIHCAQGKSRSGAVLVAYLMQQEAIGYDEALKMAQKSRSIIQPNASFERELRKRE